MVKIFRLTIFILIFKYQQMCRIFVDLHVGLLVDGLAKGIQGLGGGDGVVTEIIKEQINLLIIVKNKL